MSILEDEIAELLEAAMYKEVASAALEFETLRVHEVSRAPGPPRGGLTGGPVPAGHSGRKAKGGRGA
jgi:hypothetical protein